MGLELKVEQKQRVYQKQIEQARILQMNAQELAVCIQEAALENPLIELEEMMEIYRRASVARRLVDSTGRKIGKSC